MKINIPLILAISILCGCDMLLSTPSQYGDPILATKAICHWRTEATGYLPDANCTPGDVFANATKEVICVKGYTAKVRDVSGTTKEQVYANYGVLTRQTGEYEVDHLIPLELGGSNSVSNLFPEPAEPKPGFHEKDLIENLLNDKVCSGEITLSEAQQQIATNWTIIYWKYY